jgi:hypothetical protein
MAIQYLDSGGLHQLPLHANNNPLIRMHIYRREGEELKTSTSSYRRLGEFICVSRESAVVLVLTHE